MARLNVTLRGGDGALASSGSYRARSAVDLGLSLVVISALAMPMLLTHRAYFGDWGNHLLLLDHQSRWLESHLRPTYFVHTAETAAFYPHFLFYGGTLYWLVGCLATVTGTAVAYKVSSLAAMVTCYFGSLWLARQVHVTGLAAHLPAIVLTTGPYYLSKQYLDGGWPEFIALSMMPMVVASAYALLTASSNGIGPGVALVASSVVLTGSHAISAEYGVIFLFSLAAAVAVALRGSVKAHRKRVLLVLMLGAASVGINAWFLVPAAAYAHLTVIGHSSLFYQFDSLTAALNDWRVVFHLGRMDPRMLADDATKFYVQQPALVLLWVMAMGGLFQRRAEVILRRMFWALVILLVGYLGLILWSAPWRFAPELLLAIQFRFRLHPYVAYCIAGLLIITLLMAQRTVGAATRRWLVCAVAMGCMANVAAGVWQAWSAPRFLKISEILGSKDALPPIVYANCPAPCPWVNRDYRMVERLKGAHAPPAKPVDLEDARNGTLSVALMGGELTLVNVAWSPLIAVKAGRATIRPGAEGLVMVDTRKERPGVPTRIQLGTRSTAPTGVGAAISLACLVTVVVTLLRLRELSPGRGGRKRATSAGGPNVTGDRRGRSALWAQRTRREAGSLSM